jgi:integrase
VSREAPKDRWHTSRPGAQPCPQCRNVTGQPTRHHGSPDRWEASWDEYSDGQRRQRSRAFRYRQEAAAFQRKMRTAIADKSLPPGLRFQRGGVTVAGFFPRFMELTARDRSAGSHGKVRSQFTRMIAPHLGGWELGDLQHQPGAIREWQARLRLGAGPDGEPGGKAYAPGTVGEAFALLSSVFRVAQGERATGVTVNPCQHPQAKPGKADRGRHRGRRAAGWTAEKIAAAYLAPMPDRPARGSTPAWPRYRTAVLLAGTTGGMRLGEVMALAPEDIDRDRQLITMAYSLSRDSGGALHFREGKSDASQRVMTAVPLVLAALDAHLAAVRPVTVTLPLETAECYGQPMEAWPLLTRTLVFSTGSGGVVCDPAYQSAARAGLSLAGLLPAREITPRAVRDEASGRYVPAGGPQRPHLVTARYERPSDHGLHFHALRHFYVSLLHEAGVPDVIIKHEVGHEQLSTVRGSGIPDDVTSGYTHPVPDMRDRWRGRVRDIITHEFGPLLPDLAHGSRRLAHIVTVP